MNRDLASNLALNLLLPALRRHEVLVGLSERVGNGSASRAEAPQRRELRSAEQLLPNEIFFPIIERAGLADSGSRHLTFAEMERHRGLQVASMPSPNTPAGLRAVASFAPDLILSIRYGAILKDPVIAIPRFGVLNLHSGTLPAYRGVLATLRALLNGDSEIGCTLHYIADATIDTGDILGIRTIAVQRDRSLLWHILALYPAGVALMSEAIEKLAGGVLPQRTSQPPSGGAYYSDPTPQEWAEFVKRGWRIADPSDLLDVFTRYLQ